MIKARDRFYFVITMPLNEDNQGPATIGVDAKFITYEVWDQELTTHGSHTYLPDAIDQCEELNAAYAITRQS